MSPNGPWTGDFGARSWTQCTAHGEIASDDEVWLLVAGLSIAQAYQVRRCRDKGAQVLSA
jgi:hypothetical protein